MILFNELLENYGYGMKLIKQGAEAKLFLTKHDDQKVIVKDRIKKGYRIEQIDKKIRKSRTSQEFNLISGARRVGIPTPRLFSINKEEYKIIMEYIDGERIKELLNKSDKKTIEKVCFEIGKYIGKLHSAGIIHGDLTTSNMILKNEKVHLIDFGLGFFSRKIEDQGTDLMLLQEALKSTHFKIMNICWKKIIEGYKREYPKSDEVLKKVEEIKKRARYMER
jgi:TP53 regulating kinase-like protein